MSVWFLLHLRKSTSSPQVEATCSNSFPLASERTLFMANGFRNKTPKTQVWKGVQKNAQAIETFCAVALRCTKGSRLVVPGGSAATCGSADLQCVNLFGTLALIRHKAIRCGGNWTASVHAEPTQTRFLFHASLSKQSPPSPMANCARRQQLWWLFCS